MKGRVLSWFVGSLKITIRGYCCERFFNLCAYHGIVLWKLKPLGENEFTAGISLKNFRKIRPLAKKCHVRIQVVKKKRLSFFLPAVQKTQTAVFFCRDGFRAALCPVAVYLGYSDRGESGGDG